MGDNDRRNGVVIDCEEGRRLGCQTYCCCLLVRLEKDEQEPAPPGRVKRFVEKDPNTGYCIHLDRETGRCGIWEKRPRACRNYDCNRSPLLRVVFRDGYRSLLALVTAPEPEEEFEEVKVTYIQAEKSK